MCGYIFIHDESVNDVERKTKVEQALGLLRHRGPDESAVHLDSGVALGHRRLSIIDIEKSHQPMTDPTGRYTLVYNGEIYNYQEVRKSLEEKWSFVSDGDTEVVLASLILKGTGILNEFEGMWSLAFWDKRDKKLLIARDRMGKKPAYYYKKGRQIVVCSELPALLSCLSANQISEDLDSTADYFRYGFYLPGTTAYRGINEVKPGQVITWTPEIGSKSQSYWSLETGNYQGNKGQACETLNKLLTEAVRKRMVADVEVGAFLSGGIDSSLIVNIMSKVLNICPKTFTIKFANTGFDESEYAGIMAENCGTDHYVHEFDNFNHEELERLLLEHVGQPFGDSSILPTALVSQAASQHVKVALSGDGGDELFSGYQRYQARAILRWYTRLPKKLRLNAEKVIRNLPEPVTHHSNSLLKKAHLFIDITKRTDFGRPYVAPLMYGENELELLAPDLKNMGHEPPNLSEEVSYDDLQRMMLTDVLVYLPQDILLKVDRASMANSLETRAPFLDRKVVEFAFSLRSDWHRKYFSGKKMLHETFQNSLPRKIWSRKKQGFSVPVGEWFRDGLRKELTEKIENTSSAISRNFIHSLLQDHNNGVRDHGHRLWCAYSYYVWKANAL